MALVLVLAPGIWGRLFGGREESSSPISSLVASPVAPLPLPELVQLEAGLRMPAGGSPSGWTDLILETVPRLATGDLDTVSPQAHEIARRIRPLIIADVEPYSTDQGQRFRLARVGVGLCAPGREADTRVVVTPTAVEGTAGPWTTKQRLILTAMSIESSKARVDMRTSTFALLRAPVNFLVGGAHQKIDALYALLVDPESGLVHTVVWTEAEGQQETTLARLASVNVFDSPMDIKASRILGGIPIAWSFAVTQLPSGRDVILPNSFRDNLRTASEHAAEAAEYEAVFRSLLSGETAPK